MLLLTDANRAELKQLKTSFSDLEELKNYRVENYDVGYGTLSSIVSRFREPQPDLQIHARLIREFVVSSVAVYRSVQNYLDQDTFDRVYVYNGRYAIQRAVVRACESKGVPCWTHERGHDLRHYALYENTMPHDLAHMERLIRDTWANASTNPYREQIACSFFEERSQGIVRSWFSYVQKQQDGLLPADWDNSKRNVVIFGSSDDEFVAIGDAWRNPIYKSQDEAIFRLIDSIWNLPKDIYLYLRMHPNMKEVKTPATEALKLLSGSRFKVILPVDKVSTYALMRSADKIVTFGSTAGIEATYWGRPSILAGTCYYKNLGVTYNPRTHEELLDMIGSTLPAKKREDALMYGYYMYTFGIPFQYFEATDIFEGKFRGSRIQASNWVTKPASIITKSSAIAQLFTRAARAIARKRITGRFSTAR